MASGTNSIPAGLELVYDLEKGNVENALDAFVLSLHWSIVRTGLRQRSLSNSNEYTERLPSNWAQRNLAESSTRTLTLNYHDPHNSRIKYELKVIELTPNDMVAVTFFRSSNTGVETSNDGNQAQTTGQASSAAASANRPASTVSSGVDKNSAASTFQIGNFVRNTAFQTEDGRNRAIDVYDHADLLEVQLYENIMEPLGLRVMGQPPVLGPYEDKTKSSESSNNSQRESNPLAADDRYFRPELGRHPSPLNPGLPLGPLHVPPVGGGGGLGRSDLDPLGRFGQGNILDPRGFRAPRGGMPGVFPGHPPGARFDPFGPPNPARPDRGTGSFAVPNPDAERPFNDDYDDMFM